MKHCLECGCLMHDTHEADICEVCTEEMGGLKSDIVRLCEEDEESQWSKVNPYINKERV